MNSITKSHVCGVSCKPGGSTCNGYCKDGSIKAPGTYQIELTDFGAAIAALKKGDCVARAGWNGKGMFLYLIKGSELQSGLKYGFGEYIGEPEFVSTICMKTADNKLVAGWLASQTDMLAEDWSVMTAPANQS